MKPKVLFALPCYNEAQNIPALLDQFKKLNLVYHSMFEVKVVVIDDCSRDQTQEVLKKYPREGLDLDIVVHEKNKGLTGGINTAFSYFENVLLTQENPPIAFGLMDGDNSHSPLHIPSMVEKILQSYDLVVASRFQPGATIKGVSWIRQILSLGLAFIFKAFRNIPGVRDYSCGYRLYSPELVKKLKKHFRNDVVLDPSFASMVELLVKCHLLGAICTEVPFLLRYDLKLGESKMPFKKTIINNLKLLATLRRV